MFLKELIRFNKPDDPYIRHLLSITCILIVFILGYSRQELALASFGALGISTFNYYQPFTYMKLIKRLCFVGLFMAASNFLGMLATHLHWTAPFAVGIVAFSGRFLFRLYQIEKPGPYFSVMFVAIGVSSQVPLRQIPLMSLFFLFGVIIALMMALLLRKVDPRKRVYPAKCSLKKRIDQDPAVIIDSYLYSNILFFATYLSFSLNLHNPYWLVVSCAAILQGDNLRDVFTRHIQRIVGTIIGLVIAAILLEIKLSILEQMFIIALLYMIVDFLAKRNYIVLLIFSTPMALMLSNLIHHRYVATLIQYRFISIMIGSILGVLSAWLFTVSLKFYIRKYQVKSDFDKK